MFIRIATFRSYNDAIIIFIGKSKLHSICTAGVFSKSLAEVHIVTCCGLGTLVEDKDHTTTVWSNLSYNKFMGFHF